MLNCLQSFCVWRFSYSWRMWSFDFYCEFPLLRLVFVWYVYVCVVILEFDNCDRRNLSWRDRLLRIICLDRVSLARSGLAPECLFPRGRLVFDIYVHWCYINCSFVLSIKIIRETCEIRVSLASYLMLAYWYKLKNDND